MPRWHRRLFDLTNGWIGTIVLGSPAAAARPDRAQGGQVGDLSGDRLEVVLVQPADNPSVIMIRWPDTPTVTTPSRLNAVAAEAMKILAYASSRCARIRAQRRY